MGWRVRDSLETWGEEGSRGRCTRAETGAAEGARGRRWGESRGVGGQEGVSSAA